MILLDTCTFLWLILNEEKLSKKAREKITLGSEKIFLSSISVYEIGILQQKKRVILPLPLEEWIETSSEFMDIEEVPITHRIASAASQLKTDHRDPADRIIMATAREKKLTVLTPDREIQKYKDIKTLW